MAEMSPRSVKVCDFVAKALEAEADRMPPSYKEQTDTVLVSDLGPFIQLRHVHRAKLWRQPRFYQARAETRVRARMD